MLHERGVPRPLFLVGAGLATAAVTALAAFADLGALYPVTILAGLAFGAPRGSIGLESQGLGLGFQSRQGIGGPGRAVPRHHPGRPRLWRFKAASAMAGVRAAKPCFVCTSMRKVSM